MSESGSQGKWTASSVKEKDIKELREVRSSSNEDAGPSALSSAGKKVQKGNKGAKDGPRCKGTSDAVSGETNTHSSEEDEDGEEDKEESNPSPKGKKKRAASEDREAGMSKRGKLSLPDGSDSDAEAIPEWRPRPKPLAESPARDLPQQSSEGNSLDPGMMESESPPRASPPTAMDDTKVLSHRASPGHRAVQETLKTVPEGNALAAENMGGAIPMKTNGGGIDQFGPQPNLIPETQTASLLAATAQAAKVSELKHKLGLADEDLVRINKRLDEAQVEALQGELTQAKEQARVNKAATNKAAEDLKAEQAIRCQYEERVTQVKQALKDAADKYKSLEAKSKAQATDLAEALKEAEEARAESRAAREEIKQAEQIAAEDAISITAILHAENKGKLYTGPKFEKMI
nr:nucleolin-like [Aegilops tauschii subsp. strangulata]